jgi:hypothetical protein
LVGSRSELDLRMVRLPVWRIEPRLKHGRSAWKAMAARRSQAQLSANASRDAPSWKLEPSFRCRSCGTRRYKSPVRMIKLTEQRDPDEERQATCSRCYARHAPQIKIADLNLTTLLPCAGKAGMLPLPACSWAFLFAQIARETAGAASTRSFLRPLSSGGQRRCKPRAQCVARSRSYIHRQCERSEAIHLSARALWIASLRSQ